MQLRSVIATVLAGEHDLSTAEGRAKERHRRAAQASLGSLAARAISIVVNLISIPLTIRYLGPDRYGAWLTIISFTSVLAFADLGLGNGILNAIATAHGNGDTEAQARVTSTAFVLLSGIGLLLVALFLGTVPLLDWSALMGVTHANSAEVNAALLSLLACIALSLPGSITNRVQLGQQRGLESNLWQSAGGVISLVLLLIAVKLRAGLPSLVLATSGGPILAMVLSASWEFGVRNRALAPRFAKASRSVALELARAGLYFFALQLAAALAFGTDSLIIAHRLGASAVTAYALPMKLFAFANMAPQILFSGLWPAYGEAQARGDIEWTLVTLRRTLLATFVLSSLPSAFLCLFGNWLLWKWTGTIISVPSAAWLGMACWTVLSGLGATLAIYLNGTGRLTAQVICAIMMAIAAVVLKYVLAGQWGALGVPWALVISYVTFTAIPLGIYVRGLLREQSRGAVIAT